MSTVYCIDTSSLIGAFVRHYPRSSFPGFWREFEQLIEHGRVFAPEAVYGELKGRKDALAEWAKSHAQMFLQPDMYVLARVGNIGIHFPAAAQTTIAENKADPFLVALADNKQWTVVSEERGTSQEIPTIPQMCKRYAVPCIQLVEVITRERWVFS